MLLLQCLRKWSTEKDSTAQWVFPQTCAVSSARAAGTAAYTTDLSDPTSQQRAKCYFCICCLSCFKGHQKEDEKLMVLKVTAPKEERTLEQCPAALARQGGKRREKPRKKKELELERRHCIRSPSCPTPVCENKYYILMFLHHSHSTNSFSLEDILL